MVLDFDGVLTDNRVWVSEDGSEAVACHRGDGLGISLLREGGVETVVLSSEENPVVSARCRKLDIDCVQGLDEKVGTLRKIVDEKGLSLSQVAYIGNDVNDLSCLQVVGFPIVVADAHPDVIPAASLVLSRDGGRGAVREFCDILLSDGSSGERREDV